MSGPTPVTATHLAVANYTVDSFAHKLQMYCNANPSGDPSGFDLIGRPGVGNPGFSTVVDPLFGVLAPFYQASVTLFSGIELFEKIGANYVPVANVLTTVAATGTQTYSKAYVFDVVGKSPATRNMHTYLAEGAFGQSFKFTSLVGQPSSIIALINFFYRVSGTMLITDAANWRLSRGAVNTVRWVSGVNDTNEKLRRLRGIK